MSSVLYLLFERASGGAGSIAGHVQGLDVPGYSFSDRPLQGAIRAPGEPNMPVRRVFYAQNYFRVWVSDLAVEFHHEVPLPPELVPGERLLRFRMLDIPGFKLRRWVATSEGWGDDDKKFVRILSQGSSRETLRAELDAPPNGGPATRLANSGVAEGPPSVS